MGRGEYVTPSTSGIGENWKPNKIPRRYNSVLNVDRIRYI